MRSVPERLHKWEAKIGKIHQININKLLSWRFLVFSNWIIHFWKVEIVALAFWGSCCTATIATGKPFRFLIFFFKKVTALICSDIRCCCAEPHTHLAVYHVRIWICSLNSCCCAIHAVELSVSLLAADCALCVWHLLQPLPRVFSLLCFSGVFVWHRFGP